MNLASVNWLTVLQDAATVVGVAATAAAAIPQAKPEAKWLGIARKVLDVAAANVGNAKNAPKPPQATP